MKYCVYCGNPMDDNARFCFACGKETADTAPAAPAAYTEPVSVNEEQECLDNFHKAFKFERLAWKILGIIMLVCAIVYAFLGGMITFLGLLADGNIVSVMGMPYLLISLIFMFPVAIFNLKMVSRAEYYMDTLYTDTAGMVKRTSSIGMIVLGAIFNQYALICIIISFVRTKSNKAVLDRIIARQNAGCDGNF